MSNHFSTAKTIGEEVGYSHATVLVMAKRLGISFPGHTPEMHEQLLAALKKKRVMATEDKPPETAVPPAKPKRAKQSAKQRAKQGKARPQEPAPAQKPCQPYILLQDALELLWPEGISVTDYGRAATLVSVTVNGK